MHESTWRAYYLRTFEKLSLAEIAREVGKSVSAAANAIYRVDHRIRTECDRLAAEAAAPRGDQA